MDPQKLIEKVLLEKDPLQIVPFDDYSIEAKLLVKELQYVKSVEKISMVLYTIFSKQYTPKQALLDWKPVAVALLADRGLSRFIGRLVK